jgi:predicted Fe-Mo cluster-binding NifX family protein
MGRRIYDDLKQAGIEVYMTDQTDVEKALELYLSGELIDRPELGCDHKHECE